MKLRSLLPNFYLFSLWNCNFFWTEFHTPWTQHGARVTKASLPGQHLLTSNLFQISSPHLHAFCAPQHYLASSLFWSFSPVLLYSTTREETSIIFAWKLFINLPVKHSIESFTSSYRNLLGTYWQLSKYLHKALKHLVPSEGRSCCIKQRIIKHLSRYLFPSFIKGSFLLAHL